MKRLLFILFATILCGNVLFAQTTVSGTVTAAGSGEPLEGVTVFVKNMDAGAFTGADGKYSVEVPNGGTTLVFTLLNRKTVEEAIGGRSTIDVSMQDDIFQTDEVQITALNISREKKSLGYASQQLGTGAVNNVKETNLINSLSGKASGIQVLGGTGNLGSSSRILIRGVHSITGENQPLFVVDGVPLDNSNFTSANQSRGAGGYDYGNAIQDLNSEDIESINVLKGAAASALYGSRAANGVILVTTKKGKGKAGGKGIEVTLNSQTTFEKVAVLPNYQNEYGGGYGFDTVNNELFVDYATDESWGPKFNANTMVRQFYSFSPDAPEYYGKATPWVANPTNIEDFYNVGVSRNNSVGVAGGNDFSTFRLNYTNLNQTGIMPNSKLGRNTVSFNGSLQPTKKLSVSVGANYVATRGQGRSGTGYDGGNVSQAFNQWHQRQIDMNILKKYYLLPDGSQMTWNRTSAANATPKYTDNPYWTAYKNYETDARDRMYGNMVATYKLTDNLSVVGRVMQDNYTDKREERVAVGSQDIPSYTNVTRVVTEQNADAMLNYDKHFGDNFSLTAFVGGATRTNKYTSLEANTQGGLLVPNLYNISNSVSNPTVVDYKSQRRINSLMGSASFGFYNMLYVDVTARNDWSSTLPAGKNSYFYPSVSGSFVFSELAALKNNKILSFGKIRANWAQVGNDAPVYVLQNTYTPNPPVGGSASMGVNNSYKNPNLLPEISTSQEIGTELRFFNDRLGVDFTYYNTISRNQIIPLTVSATTGFTTKYINAGKLQNRGIETSLRAMIVKTKDFSWEMNVNWTRNRNKVLELYTEGTDTVTNYRIANAPFAVSLNATVGQPYGTLRGGDHYYDANGNKIIGPDGYYMVDPTVKVLGSIMPQWTGGVYNTLTYKNFSLGFLIDVRKGGSIFSTTSMWGTYSGLLAETAANGVREKGGVLEGVKAEVDGNGDVVYNDDGSPKATTVKNDVNLNAFQIFQDNGAYVSGATKDAVFDASYVKLREIKASYTVPAKAFKDSKFPFKEVTVAFVGRNMWIIHKNVPHIDPDNAISSGNVQGIEGAQLPSTRTMGFNLGLKF